MANVKKSNQSFVQQLALLSILLPPLVITPWWNFDPINVPRLLLLSTLAGGGVVLLFSKDFWTWNVSIFRVHRLVYFLSITFALTLATSLVFSRAPIWSQIYGTQGRNTGLIAFLSLMVLLLVLINVKINEIVKSFTKVMYIGAISNIGYGLIQDFGFDPIKWQNPYTPVVGTFGNPNFYAAFIGIVTIFLFSQVIFSTKSLTSKNVFDLVLIILCLYLQAKTASIQGFLMTGVGVILLIFLKVKIYRFYLTSRLFFSLIITLGIGTFFSFLGYGPFGERLVQRTLVLRTHFWEAALQMGIERPFTGFGLDSFGNWYRTYRSEKAVIDFGEGIVTDSAHSIYFDLLAGAGFLATLTFIAIQAYIMIRVLNLILNRGVNEKVHAFILCAWLAFLAQSIISVNSLALATVGFALGGLSLSLVAESKNGPNLITKMSFSKRTKSFGFIGAAVCCALVLPIFIKDIQFRSVISQNDGQKMVAFTENWPANDFQILVVAKLFYSSGYLDAGRLMVYKALEMNPRNVNALLTLVEDSGVAKSKKILIINELKSIDPFNSSFRNLKA